MRLAFDLEATGLLDSTTVDYTASPYKLKDNFKIHCAVFYDIDTRETYSFVQDECYTKMRPWIEKNATWLIGNNIVDYDLLVLKAAIGLDYTVQPDTLAGREVKIVDNMVLSKCLNPDRAAHSVDYFGSVLGYPKIDWRAKAIELGLIEHNAPKGAEFATYHPEMLVYNIRDAELSAKIYEYLMKEWGDWNWQDAVDLEHAVRDIITRQSHRGFWFNKQLALENVRELDTLMEERRQLVEPQLPPKPLGKTKAKEYIPCATQFLKNGKPSTHILKWVAKHGGEIQEREDGYYACLLGQEHKLPMAQEPLIKTEPALIKDSTHIKDWLVGIGWTPTDYKERDLTCDAKKKKISREKYEAAVEKYVEQTLSCNFMNDRCEHLEVSPKRLRDFLLSKDISKPVKVLTNPTFTVGQEKELCPHLESIAEKFPHVKLVVEYMTYQHRRNSILGGGVDPDDDEEEMEKGWLGDERVEQDGRISTPADTCGAGTSRFKHRRVANIPRVTSLYGDKMRDLFGADVANGFFQLAFDFDSLEAKVEAHYTYRYPGGPEYGVSLTAEKPNDCHSVLAKEITTLIGKAFPRNTAKSVKYGCSYNAQPKRVKKIVGCDLPTAEIVFDAFWTKAAPLKQLKEAMQKYWETKGGKKFIPGIDGRKLPIRSKGNVINTAFQSCGVICAKRAMVMQDRMLCEEGFAVDFWRDDWKNCEFVQQMIAYHDEAQFEISRSLIKFKMFKTEQEAKDFKQLNPKWSDVGHTDKGFYVAWCRAGEILVECVEKAGQYYKLNVPLTAGYMVGTSWKNCH